MPSYEAFLWGLAGAVVDQLLHWTSLRHSIAFPTYFRTAKYWVVTILLVLMGALIALAYVKSVDHEITPMTVMVIGFSGVAMFKKISRSGGGNIPDSGTSGGVSRPSIRRFINS